MQGKITARRHLLSIRPTTLKSPEHDTRQHGKKPEPSDIAGGKRNRQPLRSLDAVRCFRETDTASPNGPAASLPGMYPKERKARNLTDIWPPYSRQHPSQQPKGGRIPVSSGRWMNKHEWGICTTECHSFLKGKKSWARPQHGCCRTNLKGIKLSEMSQSRKDKYCIIPLTWGSQRGQTHRHK